MNTEPTDTAPELIPKVLDTIKERTQAKYLFSPQELADLGKALSNTRKDAERIEDELSSIKKQYSAKLETVELEQNTLCRKIDDGFEMREAFAVVTFNDPVKGRKTYRHEESGEFIREEAISAADLQLPMFRTADGTDATAPAHPERQDEEDDGMASHEHSDLIGNGEPAGTSIGAVLNQAAAVTTAPKIAMDLSVPMPPDQIPRVFKAAAKKAGWATVQVDLMLDILKTKDSESEMKECLSAHVMEGMA